MGMLQGGRFLGSVSAIKSGGNVVLGAAAGVASAVLEGCRSGRIRFGAAVAKLPDLVARSRGVKVMMRWPAQVTYVSPMIPAEGPGESAGESLRDLPAVWQAVQLPAGYIGPNMTALALARGEAWARVGSQMIVAGRVVIGESGVDAYFSDDAAARRFAAVRFAAASMWVGIVNMGPGSLRDDLVSKRRDAVWMESRRAARAVRKVADIARRRAMMADIDFALRGV